LKTVVILGAGASADFGLPLGGALFDQASSTISSLIRDWKYRANEDAFWSFNRAVSFVRTNDVYKALLPHMYGTDASGQQNIGIHRFEEILAAMNSAPAYSLDTFALEFPDHADVVRTLTADLIIRSIKKQIARDERGKEIRNFDTRLVDHLINSDKRVYNWIHLFCSMVRNELTADAESRYGIISFNYDRLFEKVGARGLPPKKWSGI